MSLQNGNVTVERREQIVILTLNRPEQRNAMNMSLWNALAETVASLKQDPARAVIITGAGKAFSAGMDITENEVTTAMFEAARGGKVTQFGDFMRKVKGVLHNVPDIPLPTISALNDVAFEGVTKIRGLMDRFKNTLDELSKLPMPTIAAINGAAFGGGAEITLSCDFRIIDENATICLSETRIGIIPDLGGIVRLINLLGRSRALDLICTARNIRPDEALTFGLVNRIAPAGHALDAAIDMAALIAQNGPASVRAAKKVALSLHDFHDAMAVETEAAIESLLSGEVIEGITAWRENRKPTFKDPHNFFEELAPETFPRPGKKNH